MKLLFLLATMVNLVSELANAQECPANKDYSDCLQKQQAAEESAMLGKYVCVFDRIAGIQHSDNEGTSVEQIRVPSDHFFVEISRDESVDCDEFLFHDEERKCKSKFRLSVKSEC
jgi:hypothetical protein